MKSRILTALPATILLFVVTASVGCSSSSGKNGAATKKGGGATSAQAAKAAGQKVGATAKKDEAKSEDIGAGGGAGATGGVAENGGAHDAAAAAAAGEKVGAVAKADEAKSVDEGTTAQSLGGSLHISDVGDGGGAGGVECDAAHENEGFCVDATHIEFCDAGHWHKLDCTTHDGDHCGEDLASHVVDCHPTKDFASGGSSGAPDAVCDASEQGVGYCGDADHVIFCDGGHWHSLTCSTAEGGSACEEEDDNHVVDCAHDGDALLEAH